MRNNSSSSASPVKPFSAIYGRICPFRSLPVALVYFLLPYKSRRTTSHHRLSRLPPQPSIVSLSWWLPTGLECDSSFICSPVVDSSPVSMVTFSRGSTRLFLYYKAFDTSSRQTPGFSRHCGDHQHSICVFKFAPRTSHHSLSPSHVYCFPVKTALVHQRPSTTYSYQKKA